MPHRSLNIKFALVLGCATAVLGAGVHVLHAFQVKRGARGLLARALSAESHGKVRDAKAGLDRYLALRPDDIEALERLGRLVERTDPTPEGRALALRIYRKALRLSAGRGDIRRRVIDLAIAQGDFTEALPHVEVLLHESPENAELTYLLGRCQESAGRTADAAAAYEKARKLDPARVEAYTRLAELCRGRLRDADRADRVMDARADKDGLVARNRRSPAAYLERARYRTRYAVPGVDADADIARALELAPDDPDVLLAAAQSAQQRDRADEARKLLDRGLEKHPNLITFYRALADLELKSGRTEDALRWMRTGFERNLPDANEAQASLGWLLADTLITLRRADEAGPLIAKLKERNVRPELLDYLESRLLVARSKWAAAARRWEEVLPALAAQPAFNPLTKRALLSLANCYEQLGNLDQRYDACYRAAAIDIENDPVWSEARLSLAAALVDLNRLNDAIEQYRIVMPREAAAGLFVARLQIVQNLRRPVEEQRWDEVEQTLRAVERGTQSSQQPEAASGVSILRAENLAAQGKLSPARRVLETARDKFPEDIDLWIALANVAGREGEPEETLAVLDEARRKFGPRVELRLARTAYWAAQGGEQARPALAEVERGADELPPQDRARLRRELAAAYSQLGLDEQAKALWTALAAEEPGDLSVRLALFNWALKADDEPGAEKALEEIRRVEGNGPLGHYGAAVLLVRRATRERSNAGLLAKARAELQQAAARRPAWGRVALTRGEVEALSGNVEAAIQDYLRAILQMGERDANVVGRVLELLNSRGRVAEAAQIVQKLSEERVPLSGDLQRLVAQISYQAGDPGRALKFAQSTVAADSRNPDELIWLAQIQWAAGQSAEPTLRRAVALAGDSPKAWLALIVYLASTGQKDQAEQALEKAEKALPADRAALALAQASEAVGRGERAAALYKQAADANPDDVGTLRALASFYLRSGRRADAETMLERVIQLGGTTTNAAWARRLLATLMAASGNHQRTLRALEILGLSAESAHGAQGPAPAPDVRAQARILAVQPNRGRRREAIALLEQLVKRNEAKPDDLFLLAQLDDADGDWPKARARMLEVVNAKDASPVHLANLIRALLRHDSTEQAVGYLAKLERAVPEAPGTVELKARVLLARGKPADAIAVLRAYVKADEKRTEPVARLLEELKQLDAAEALYRQLAAHDAADHPVGTVALALFLGRHRRTGEALDVIDRVWAKLPPETAAHACVLALYGNVDDSAHHERVARRLEQEAKAHPDSTPLQFDLANVRILQDRYADAEAIYRSVYERDKTLSAPLNNLAWLLAMRGGDRADEALVLINQAIDRSGETPNLLGTRAVAHLAKGQTDLAIRELEDAIAVGTTPKAYVHLARAYELKGRHDEAAQAARRAKELGLTVADLHPLERATFGALLGTKR